MQQFKEYLEEASINTEDIKRGVVDFINSVVISNNGNPINIEIGKKLLRNVSAAKPLNLPSRSGIAPYSDIELILSNGSTIRLSVRVLTGKRFDGRTVPALADGMNSLENLFPQIRRQYLGSLLDHLVNKEGLSHGQIIPQSFGRLVGKMKETALMGDSTVGGEADYVLAVQRVSFKFKKMRIPFMEVVPGTYGATIRAGKMDSKLYDKSEVLKNNDIYIFHKDMKGKTVYLFDDVVDKLNNPVVVGPSLTTKKTNFKMKDFPQKIKAKLNINVKKNVFDIDPSDTKYFKLELIDKNTARLPVGQSDAETEERSLARRGGFGRGSEEEKYYPKIIERKKNVEEIINKYKIAIKTLERKDITSDSEDKIEEMILMIMKNEDDEDIRSYSNNMPHRLYNVLNTRYHSKLTDLIQFED